MIAIKLLSFFVAMVLFLSHIAFAADQKPADVATKAKQINILKAVTDKLKSFHASLKLAIGKIISKLNAKKAPTVIKSTKTISQKNPAATIRTRNGGRR